MAEADTACELSVVEEGADLASVFALYDERSVTGHAVCDRNAVYRVCLPWGKNDKFYSVFGKDVHCFRVYGTFC